MLIAEGVAGPEKGGGEIQIYCEFGVQNSEKVFRFAKKHAFLRLSNVWVVGSFELVLNSRRGDHHPGPSEASPSSF